MIIDNQEFLSSFIAGLNIKNSTQLIEKFIKPKLSSFFKDKKIDFNSHININKQIADVDFNNKELVKFSYFYENLFNDIAKDNNDNINLNIKYCLTLDEENCKIKCEKTGILYDEILLYNQPVFYFIYINIQDIFKFLRQNNVDFYN